MSRTCDHCAKAKQFWYLQHSAQVHQQISGLFCFSFYVSRVCKPEETVSSRNHETIWQRLNPFNGATWQATGPSSPIFSRPSLCLRRQTRGPHFSVMLDCRLLRAKVGQQGVARSTNRLQAQVHQVHRPHVGNYWVVCDMTDWHRASSPALDVTLRD